MSGDLHAHLITRAIRNRIAYGLARTRQWLGISPGDPHRGEILRLAEGALDRIAARLDAGDLHPAPPLRLSHRPRPERPVRREVRLGVYPVNGNPLHWGHLLTCLEAIADHRLDLVALVVQGDDPRKALSTATERHRHAMAREVLQVFAPLVAYSDVGRGSVLVGEDHLFRLLSLNSHQRIAAHYLVGSDHYRHVDAAGNPDTLTRLERNVAARAHGFDPERHTLRVVFLDRAGGSEPLPTPLDVVFVKSALPVSSTAVRAGELVYTPYEALRYMHRNDEYTERIGVTKHLQRALAAAPAAAAAVSP